MGTILTLVHAPNEGLLVLESYNTVKKRIYDSRDFVDVTVEKRVKATLNKRMILGVSPEPEKKKKGKK